MTFIDRLETDLVRASEARAASARPWTAPVQRLARRASSRKLALLAALAAVATPAIAIGLGPVLHDYEGRTLSTSAGAPPAEQLALLGILRDPSPRAYVDPETLRSSLLSEINGIRTNYIRLLPPAPGFPHQLLYSVTSGNLPPPRFDPETESPPAPAEEKNRICVESIEGDGLGGVCTGTDVLTSGRWFESAGLDVYGLVPDGVASVILHYSDHSAQRAAVTENTFSYRGYPAPEGLIINGGGAEHPSPGPTPEIPTDVTWLNDRGAIIANHARGDATEESTGKG